MSNSLFGANFGSSAANAAYDMMVLEEIEKEKKEEKENKKTDKRQDQAQEKKISHPKEKKKTIQEEIEEEHRREALEERLRQKGLEESIKLAKQGIWPEDEEIRKNLEKIVIERRKQELMIEVEEKMDFTFSAIQTALVLILISASVIGIIWTIVTL